MHLSHFYKIKPNIEGRNSVSNAQTQKDAYLDPHLEGSQGDKRKCCLLNLHAKVPRRHRK